MAKKAKVNIDLNIESSHKQDRNTTIETPNTPLMFGKKNYQFMILGLIIIFIGYGLMMGKNNNVESLTAEFPADDVYSFRRIILAPIVIIFGFLVELYSIISIKKSAE